jgi:hypothetical protein
VFIAGMNGSAMPAAAMIDAGSTSTANEPSGRTSDISAMPAARTSMPATIVGLIPRRAITRGATSTTRTMTVIVIGSSAAPPSNAPRPSTCWR